MGERRALVAIIVGLAALVAGFAFAIIDWRFRLTEPADSVLAVCVGVTIPVLVAMQCRYAVQFMRSSWRAHRLGVTRVEYDSMQLRAEGGISEVVADRITAVGIGFIIVVALLHANALRVVTLAGAGLVAAGLGAWKRVAKRDDVEGLVWGSMWVIIAWVALASFLTSF